MKFEGLLSQACNYDGLKMLLAYHPAAGGLKSILPLPQTKSRIKTLWENSFYPWETLCEPFHLYYPIWYVIIRCTVVSNVVLYTGFVPMSAS